VVERRINRVPDDYLPLLNAAAISGRELDFGVLKQIIANSDDDIFQQINIDDWLTTLANISIFTNWDGRWRFAHDKLRDVLIENMTADDVKSWHRQVATAIEQVYPDDPAQAVLLTDHWHDAGEPEKEVYYAQKAGELLLNNGSFKQALTMFERALTNIADDDVASRMRILKLTGDVFENQSQYDDAVTFYESSLDLAQELGDVSGIADATDGLGDIARQRGELAEAQAFYEAAIVAAQQANNRLQIAETMKDLGSVSAMRGNLDAAQEGFEESLKIFREVGLERGIAASLNNLGIVMRYKGNTQAAKKHYEDALAIRREIGHKRGVADSLNNLGTLSNFINDYDAAVTYYTESAEIFRDIGDMRGIGIVLNNLGSIYAAKGDYMSAIECLTDYLPIARDIGDQRGIAYALESMGRVAILQGNYNAALDYVEDSVAIARDIGDKRATGNALRQMGIAQRELRRYKDANKNFQDAFVLYEGIADTINAVDVLHHLALSQMRDGEIDIAHAVLKRGLGMAFEQDNDNLIVTALSGFVELFLLQKDLQRAAQLVGYVHRHRLENDLDNAYVRGLYDRIEAELPTKIFASETNIGQNTNKDHWKSELL
jgi:tetratricopeptide (TPR) repeat protein